MRINGQLALVLVTVLAVALSAGPAPSATRSEALVQHVAKPTIPNGVYVVTTTVADLRAGGVIGPDFNKNIVYTTKFQNGRWYQTQKPNYPDQGPFSGTYKVRGDQVVFVMLKAGLHGQNNITAPETVKWSYFDRKLRFKIVTVADVDSIVLYTAHPWVKIR